MKLSPIIGYLLAGIVIGPFTPGFVADRAFAVLFFVSIGMLFDPRSLVEIPMVIGAVIFVVIIIKPLAAMLTVRMLGQPLSTAIPVGAAFSQVGEFSFILGTVALSLGLINDAGWNALVAASILSIGLNPYIYRFARKLSSGKSAKTLPAISNQRPAMNPNHCILIGYGPVGKIVRRLLKERGVEITVIDLNLDTVRGLHEMGATLIRFCTSLPVARICETPRHCVTRAPMLLPQVRRKLALPWPKL